MPDGFAELFAGREDAFGTEDGGCWRNEFGTPAVDIIERHLDGTCPIGVYPIVEGCVRWGCVDFDVKADNHPSYDYETEDDAHVAAMNLKRVLERLDVISWIERTRSHGRHVWVFAQGWVPAAAMRRCLLVAAQVAGVSTREVNPKQETLPEGKLGNYVRLPYPGLGGGWQPTAIAERVVLHDGAGDWRQYVPLSVDTFVDLALELRTPLATLNRVAAHFIEPPCPHAPRDFTPYRGELRELTKRLDGKGFVVFRDGPHTGDRSGGLAYVAHACARSGLTYDEALTVLVDADERWGKFSKRSDGLEQLSRITSRAYG